MFKDSKNVNNICFIVNHNSCRKFKIINPSTKPYYNAYNELLMEFWWFLFFLLGKGSFLFNVNSFNFFPFPEIVSLNCCSISTYCFNMIAYNRTFYIWEDIYIFFSKFNNLQHLFSISTKFKIFDTNFLCASMQRYI